MWNLGEKRKACECECSGTDGVFFFASTLLLWEGCGACAPRTIKLSHTSWRCLPFPISLARGIMDSPPFYHYRFTVERQMYICMRRFSPSTFLERARARPCCLPALVPVCTPAALCRLRLLSRGHVFHVFTTAFHQKSFPQRTVLYVRVPFYSGRTFSSSPVPPLIAYRCATRLRLAARRGPAIQAGLNLCPTLWLAASRPHSYFNAMGPLSLSLLPRCNLG